MKNEGYLLVDHRASPGISTADLKRAGITRQTAAKVTAVDSLLDINTQQRLPAAGLKLNDIARIALTVQQPLAADAYDDIRATGAFILIDEVTHQTVAAGMIRLGE